MYVNDIESISNKDRQILKAIYIYGYDRQSKLHVHVALVYLH